MRLLADLEAILTPDQVSQAPSHLSLHSADQSNHAGVLPDVVVWPKTSAETSAITTYAFKNSIPIVGWGAGSSLEGNPIPVRGGIVVDFGRMNAIVEIHAEDFQVTVQPGIFYRDMNKQLAQYGLFFAPDPGANASIGGMIANNAAGTRTVKYGATRENVLALEVVLADGRIMRCGSRSVKQSAGYDLTHLIVGSEGTLGLVTEATLRLHPLPEHFSAVLATFESTAQAAAVVYEIIGSGLNPAALELLDAASIAYMNTLDGIDLPLAPTLLMEFHGATLASLAAELALVKVICEEGASVRFEEGLGRDARDKLWQGRHMLGEVLFRAARGRNYLITDVAVPISQYPALATYAASLYDELKLEGALFGHAGDGNLHTINFAEPENEPEQAAMHLFNDRVIRRGIALGGTCTGEHGVGIGKRKYMVLEHGDNAIDVMKAIKNLLDPTNILNPGKLFKS